MKIKVLFLALACFPFELSAIEWWGKELSSLRYIMPTEGFLRLSDQHQETIYLGLKDFGVDKIVFKNRELVREKTYRFQDIIDSSVGLQSLCLHRNFLIVSGIQDGFLALDLTTDYPSDRSKRHEIVFKPDEKLIVRSSALKALRWRDYLLFLTADQLVIAEMTSAIDFQIRAAIPLAPKKEQWRDYWATEMALHDDDLYLLIAHEREPVIGYIRLPVLKNEPFHPRSLNLSYVELPAERYYLKSMIFLDGMLYVSQNKALLIFEIGSDGKPKITNIQNYRYFIERVIGITERRPGPDIGFIGLGLSFWQAGFAFFKKGNLSKEDSILFPPKTLRQIEVEGDLLFGSAGEEGFVVYQKYSHSVP
jgi:hypothetical protein